MTFPEELNECKHMIIIYFKFNRKVKLFTDMFPVTDGDTLYVRIFSLVSLKWIVTSYPLCNIKKIVII